MVNSNWTYKESLFYIDLVKEEYEGVMLSFSILGGNLKLYEKAYQIKKDIYSLKFEEWQKDKLWKYLNDAIEYMTLWQFI